MPWHAGCAPVRCCPPSARRAALVEAEIHQVQDRVLDATDVLVHRQPVVAALVDHITGTRRGVAGVVPARLHEGVEGVGLALGRAAAIRAGGLAPFRVGLDRRAGTGEGHVFRQQRQLLFRHRHRAARRSRSPESGSPSSAGGSRPSRAGGVDAALALGLALETFGQGFKGALKSRPSNSAEFTSSKARLLSLSQSCQRLPSQLRSSSVRASFSAITCLIGRPYLLATSLSRWSWPGTAITAPVP